MALRVAAIFRTGIQGALSAGHIQDYHADRAVRGGHMQTSMQSALCVLAICMTSMQGALCAGHMYNQHAERAVYHGHVQDQHAQRAMCVGDMQVHMQDRVRWPPWPR
jgi:hypothetical protein